MNPDYIYSRQSEKFIEKNSALISFEKAEAHLALATKKILKVENNSADIKYLKGEWKGFYRVRIGEIRVIFRIQSGNPIIVYVERIEHRGSVY